MFDCSIHDKFLMSSMVFAISTVKTLLVCVCFDICLCGPIGFEQHSISIFAVNLDMTDTGKIASERIALTLAVSMSRNLILFAESAATRRQQFCGILSAVTGIDIANIQVQAVAPPGIIVVVFDIVISIPHYRSPYQEQRVRRLTSNFARPGSSVRNRVESMFSQLIKTWLPDYVPGNLIELLGASVRFPGEGPKTLAGSRRLFQASLSPQIQSTRDQTRHSAAVPLWNQTSSFFLRAYDTADNSDSMLAFSSVGGLFSRMCVVSVRYSQILYCLQNEKTNLPVIQELLAEPLRTASRGLIQQTIAVALAPAHTTSCETTPSTGSPLPSGNSRRSASSDSSVLLRIEIIAYTNVTGTFMLTATQELRDAGVEHISITSTKKQMNQVYFALDTVGFQNDGSLVLIGHIVSEPFSLQRSTAVVTAVVVSVVIFVLGLTYVEYSVSRAKQDRNMVQRPTVNRA